MPCAAVGPPSDFDLNPDAVTEWQGHIIPRAAAVLVPVVAREVLTLLLTQRTDGLQAHAGQIAFPGGKADPGDDGPLSTALREAEEEIGLARHLVEPLGVLDRYRTGTGFEITPVVALVKPSFLPVADPREVADVFEVPLAFLMDPVNHHRHTRSIAGRDRNFYAMPFGERYIWGATAGILRNMHERLFTP
jgi:8-oxo-dGTP pyrophosphatase MutT (NUDIX family)